MFRPRFPALKRWAILGRPFGTQANLYFICRTAEMLRLVKSKSKSNSRGRGRARHTNPEFLAFEFFRHYFVYQLGVGLAFGGFHDLSDEKAQHCLFSGAV